MQPKGTRFLTSNWWRNEGEGFQGRSLRDLVLECVSSRGSNVPAGTYEAQQGRWDFHQAAAAFRYWMQQHAFSGFWERGRARTPYVPVRAWRASSVYFWGYGVWLISAIKWAMASQWSRCSRRQPPVRMQTCEPHFTDTLVQTLAHVGPRVGQKAHMPMTKKVIIYLWFCLVELCSDAAISGLQEIPTEKTKNPTRHNHILWGGTKRK